MMYWILWRRRRRRGGIGFIWLWYCRAWGWFLQGTYWRWLRYRDRLRMIICFYWQKREVQSRGPPSASLFWLKGLLLQLPRCSRITSILITHCNIQLLILLSPNISHTPNCSLIIIGRLGGKDDMTSGRECVDWPKYWYCYIYPPELTQLQYNEFSWYSFKSPSQIHIHLLCLILGFSFLNSLLGCIGNRSLPWFFIGRLCCLSFLSHQFF